MKSAGSILIQTQTVTWFNLKLKLILLQQKDKQQKCPELKESAAGPEPKQSHACVQQNETWTHLGLREAVAATRLKTHAAFQRLDVEIKKKKEV